MINTLFELRVKIDDILNLGEKDIMEFMIEIIKKIKCPKIIFWHNEINPLVIDEFISRWKETLEQENVVFKVININENMMGDYVWFDILNKTDNRNKFKHRFKCIIDNNKMELISALLSYYNTVKFVKDSSGKKIKYIKEVSNGN